MRHEDSEARLGRARVHLVEVLDLVMDRVDNHQWVEPLAYGLHERCLQRLSVVFLHLCLVFVPGAA